MRRTRSFAVNAELFSSVKKQPYLIPRVRKKRLKRNQKKNLSVPTSTVIPPTHLPLKEAHERAQIVELLEKIRKANLEKDIRLFMSCYSKDFKDWEEKKKTTLESWGNFNFLNLTYELKTYSISGNALIARVEWLLRFSQKNGGPSQDSKTALEVTLKKEDGTWEDRRNKISLMTFDGPL